MLFLMVGCLPAPDTQTGRKARDATTVDTGTWTDPTGTDPTGTDPTGTDPTTNPIANLTVLDLAPGDLAIHEVFADPGACEDADGEWIEIEIRTSKTLDLNRLLVMDSANTVGLVTQNVLVEPGELVVLARGSGNSFCGIAEPVAYLGKSLWLNNGSGEQLRLMAERMIIHQSEVLPMPVTGMSYGATEDGWCTQSPSPGAANHECEQIIEP